MQLTANQIGTDLLLLSRGKKGARPGSGQIDVQVGAASREPVETQRLLTHWGPDYEFPKLRNDNGFVLNFAPKMPSVDPKSLRPA